MLRLKKFFVNNWWKIDLFFFFLIIFLVDFNDKAVSVMILSQVLRKVEKMVKFRLSKVKSEVIL